MTFVGVLLAGAAGAVARYLVDGAVQSRVGGVFPWGTFLINITGSFILGLIVGLALYQGLSDAPRTIVGTGFCGAYTTFSTFTYETVRLGEEGSRVTAFTNVVGSTLAGVLAAAAGLALAASF